MSRCLNLKMLSSYIMVLLCINSSFSQTFSLNDDELCAPRNKDVRVFPFDNDNFEAGTLDFSSFRIVTPAEKTIINWSSSNYTLRLTPDPLYTGDDYFVYEICTLDGVCDQATVNMTFNDPIMIPIFDNYISYKNDVVGNVLANDILEVDIKSVSGYSIILSSDVTNGTLDFQDDGSFTYSPDEDFTGKDYFTYQICGKSFCDDMLVSINVVDLPDNEAYYVVANDISLVINANTTLYNFDLHKTNLNQIDPNSEVTYNVLSPFANGIGSLTDDGRFSFIPYYNAKGMDELVYEVCVDGECYESIILINIMDEQFNCSRHFPQAINDNLVTCSGEEVGLNVADNDYFFNTDLNSRVELIRDVEHGNLVLEQNGTLKYTPDFNFVGIDYLEYQICDYDFAALSYPSKYTDNFPDIIIDGTVPMAEDGLLIPAQGALSNINVEIDIEHANLSNLQITLVSPEGRSVILLDDLCDASTSLNLIISELATQDVDCTNSDIQIVRPYESFSTLEEQEIVGDWILQIRNKVENNSLGEVTKWGIRGDVTPFKEKFCRIARVEIPVLSKAGTVDLNLLDFSVEKVSSNSAEVKWISEERGEADNYELQRSQANTNFVTVYTTGAKNNIDAAYAFVDEVKTGGQTYYRLKKNEIDGRYYFSDIKTVRFDNPNNVSLRSNLVDASLEIVNTADLEGQIDIVDLSGRVVLSTRMTGGASNMVDVTSLSDGIYIVNLRLAGENINIKWIKS